VMTVHQAKGLEFDVVYVVGLTAAGWPGSDRSTPDIPDQLLPEALPRGREAHQAEARRLAYVAMTRARHTLVLSYPERAPSGAPNRPSPYYDEARAVAGDPDVRRVGRSAAVRLLEAVGEARARHEAASAAAARAIARGEAATSEQAAVSEAAKALATARGEALAGAKEAPPPLPESDRPRSVHGVTLSPTDIEQYRTCPLAYRYARIDRIPTPPSADRAIGVAAHTALEAHYRPGGSGGDGATLVRRFEQELPATARAGVDAARAQQALERAREWLPKYHDRFIKAQLKPVAVERAFTLPIGSHRVRGRIDRVDEHPAGGTQLVDYKTGRPPMESQRGGDNLVLRLYLAGARDAWGIYARGATLEYVFDGRATPVNPDTQEVEEALTEAGRIADGIARGDFEPKPGWACRSCDFAGLCPAQER
jgi:DNA helicase-2/ATP-dependent DNA helicase PcrA